MKKIILTVAAVFVLSFANAQDGGFKAGIHAGLPIGVAGDVYSANFGVDLAYMWNVADKFQAGVTTGYSFYSGKSVDLGFGEFILATTKVNGAFIPIAATGQYSLSDKLFVGADLGYALYSGDGDGDGGLYYQPKFGYQTEKIEVYLGYKGVSVTGGSVSSVGLGFNYKF
jgi:hypothetical protein